MSQPSSVLIGSQGMTLRLLWVQEGYGWESLGDAAPCIQLCVDNPWFEPTGMVFDVPGERLAVDGGVALTHLGANSDGSVTFLGPRAQIAVRRRGQRTTIIVDVAATLVDAVEATAARDLVRRMAMRLVVLPGRTFGSAYAWHIGGTARQCFADRLSLPLLPEEFGEMVLWASWASKAVYEQFTSEKALLKVPAHRVELWTAFTVYLEAFEDPFAGFSEPALEKVEALHRDLMELLPASVQGQRGRRMEQSSRAVRSRPLANAPRFAVAELAELGEPVYARFVRLQLESLGIQRRLRQHSRASLDMADEAQQIAEYNREADWARLGSIPARIHFGRGFVEGVGMSAADFLRFGKEIFQRAPVLSAILHDVKEVAAELLASPHLGRLRALSLRGEGLEDDFLAALADSSNSAQLVCLDLSSNAIGVRGLEALAASPHMKNLRWLGFRNNAAPDPTPQASYDQGAQVHIGFGATRKTLIERFGEKPWLTMTAWIDTAPPPGVLYALEDE